MDPTGRFLQVGLAVSVQLAVTLEQLVNPQFQGFQLGERLKICPDFLGCSLSMVKNVAWSVAWPLWWAMWATDFSLFHAVLGR